MASSGANKLFIGQRGFPTPNAAPDEQVCRVFLIPAQADYQALLMGALEALTHDYNWYVNGGLEQAEAAAFFANVIDQAYAQSLTGQCSLDVPAPYWDAVTDLDTEAPALSQSWYGTVHFSDPTFVEQIGIWAIAAFIAYSGQIGAAVAFLTVAPKFVLAFKTRDVGGIIRIFIDAAEYGRVDTYSASPGIANFTVVADPDLDTHQIYCVLSDETNPDIAGDPTIAVIRKELSPNDVAPANVRYDPIGDQFQQSPDDGTTWIDDPSADPRHANVFRMPAAGTGDDYRCNVAARITAQFEETIDGFIGSINAAQFATLFIAIASVLGLVGVLIDIAVIVFDALATIGASTIEGAFTDAIYDDMKCIVYCYLPADGQLTAATVTAIKNAIFTAHPGTVSDVVSLMFFLYGEILSSNAGVERNETGDCTACLCGWCFEWDFTASDGGWSQTFFGEYAGVGWQSTVVIGDGDMAYRGCEIYKTFGFDVDVTSIEVDVNVTCGVNNAGTGWILSSSAPWNGTGLIENENCITGDNETIVHSAELTLSGMTFVYTVGTAGNGNHTDPGGQVTIKRIKLKGLGINPFGDDNCI